MVFETNGGHILQFRNGTELLKGPYPDKTWDELYDIDLPKVRHSKPEWFEFPTLVINRTGVCRYAIGSDDYRAGQSLVRAGRFSELSKLVTVPTCHNVDPNFRFCSKECWYLDHLANLTGRIRKLKYDLDKKHVSREYTELVREFELFKRTFEPVQKNEWNQYREEWVA
jgi:hypothetical protein